MIGVRDSGVGGLTVARRIRQALPIVTLLYFADTAHVPYGDRPPHEVRHFALAISEFLIAQGAQVMVFACNTSSAYALDAARGRFSVPVIGMIEPGAHAAHAVSSGGRIGVLATQSTVTSGVYTRSLLKLRPTAHCLEVACPAFVPLVESEQTETPQAYAMARRYLEPLLKAEVDTVILGCTHYPLLLPVLRALAPHLEFVDPATAVAQAVKLLVTTGAIKAAAPRPAALPGEDTIYVSGPRDGVCHWAGKLLQTAAPTRSLELRDGPVFDAASSALS